MSIFKLEVSPNIRYSRICVYDGKNNLVANAENSLYTELPKGLYTVRTEFSGVTTEEIIRHFEDTRLTPELEFNTVVPFYGAKYSHEYYSGNAMQWSNQTTHAPIGNEEGSLFLFVRSIDVEHARKKNLENQLHGFSLRDQNNELISDFSSDDIAFDAEYGWAAFHAKAETGTYYLSYEGERSRVFPVFVSPGLQTQVFLMRTSIPVFRSMRIFMSYRDFNYADEMDRNVDLVLNSLQTGDYHIPEELFEYLIYGKFENPIFGFLGAYVSLKSGRPDKENLLKTIVHNIENNIINTRNCPDLDVLKFLIAKKYNEPLPDIKFNHPPMFKAGLETIIEESIHNERILAENSIIADIAMDTLHDTPWASWTVKTEERPVIGTLKNIFPKQRSRITNVANFVDDLKDWVVPSLLEAVSEMDKKDETVTIEGLARDIGLPIQTIKNKMADWSELTNNSEMVDQVFQITENYDINKKGGIKRFLGTINNLLNNGDQYNSLHE